MAAATRRSAGVQVCSLPTETVLAPEWLHAVDYYDSYWAPLRDESTSVVNVFFAVFGHQPWWIKTALLSRNAVARACGLKVPAARDVLRPRRQAHYQVGDIIGPWPIFSLSAQELVAGRDNAHLDFRLSVLKCRRDGRPGVAISTLCKTHNAYGRNYLRLIVPFHERGVQWLIAKAMAAGRL